MGKLAIGGSALEGVRLIGRRPATLLAWALAYFLLALLPTAAWAWWQAQNGAPHDTLIETAALFTRSLRWVTLPASAVLYAAIYRAVLAPDRARPPFLALSAAELRQFLLLLARTVLLIVVALGCVIAFIAAILVTAFLPAPYGVIVRIVALLGILALAVVIWLRLSMAGPMTFGEDRFRLFESWAFTKGRAGVLLGLMLLVLLTAILAELVAMVTFFGLLEIVVGMLRLRADQLSAGFSHPLSPDSAPWLVGLGLLYSVMVVAIQCVAVAPWARAWQQMASAPVPAAEPAMIPRAVAFARPPVGARFGPAWSGPVVLVLVMGLGMGLLSLGLLLTILLARQGGLTMTAQALSGWLGELGLSVGFDLLTVALLLLWTRKVEKRTLASAGFGGGVNLGDLGWFLGGALWSFVLALGLGLAMQTVAVAATDPQAAQGLLFPPEAVSQAPAVLLVIVLLAFSEEVMFRGWLLSSLAPRVGLGPAIAISSVLFAAFHVLPWELGDPARLISFVSYAAIGAGFAAVALGRGQIWSSTLLHAGYNSFLAFASMAAQHATPQKLWGAVSEARRGSSDADQALAMLGLNLAIAAVLIGLLVLARRRVAPAAVGIPVTAS